MWRLGLLVVVATHVAAADERSCKPSGKVVFEIDDRSDKPHQVTSTAKLYANGAWERESLDVDGKRMRWRAGCLELDELALITAGLRDARWELVTIEPKCTSDSPRFTLFKAAGHTVFTERPCSTKVVDHDSRTTLDTIAYWLADDHPPGLERRCLDNPLAKGCS